MGCDFTITVIDNPPYAYLRGEEFVGFYPSIVAELANKANFTYTLQFPDFSACSDTVSGSQYGCGFENAARGVTDLIFAELYATEARSNLTIMTQPTISHTGLAFITSSRLESDVSNDLWTRMRKIFEPFTFTVWAFIFLLIVPVTGGTFWILERSESEGDFGGIFPYAWHMEMFSLDEVSKGLLHTYFLSISTLTGSHAHTPRTRPGKVLSLAWQFFAMVFVAAYTAELASLLSPSKAEELRFSSFSDLRGATVCTKAGTAYSKWLAIYEENIEQYQIANGTSKEMVDAYKDGHCQAIVDARSVLDVR